MKNLILILCFIFIIFGLILWFIIFKIKEHHLQDDPKLHELKKILAPIHPIVKNIRLYKGDKSYTINKEKIFLCLHDENGEYYHNNHLIYVLIHEMSHILCDEIGHTDKFWNIFDDLLMIAISLKIYNPKIEMISDYCSK